MRVLVFGGNGRIARSMTQLMLARAWDVTSVIRNPRQEANILALGQGQPGHIDVLHYDLHDLKTSTEAVEILDKTNPTCVIFAAGSFSSVYQIDRDAAKSIIKAATTTTSVLKFLMISFPAARRTPAPWWDDKDIRNYHAEKSSYPDIAEAKIQADEYLIAMTNARHVRSGPPFQGISLRPGWLTKTPGTGRVQLGKTRALGRFLLRMLRLWRWRCSREMMCVAGLIFWREEVRGLRRLLRGLSGIALIVLRGRMLGRCMRLLIET